MVLSICIFSSLIFVERVFEFRRSFNNIDCELELDCELVGELVGELIAVAAVIVGEIFCVCVEVLVDDVVV